ncbi:MAG: hypothetical protein OEY04_01525 [Gammaproteobacteria bacterium]|nr:hypothetical protein [Gammaproteobacteria bacterium]
MSILASSLGHAMCFATTEHLVRVEVHACQDIKIEASRSRPPAHAVHKGGSSISGALVTGLVIESTIVWDGNPDMAEHTFTVRKIHAGEPITFFVNGDSSQICAAIIEKSKLFVTDTQCCDVLPADGLCLVPPTMIIAKEEMVPEQWTKWMSPANELPILNQNE